MRLLPDRSYAHDSKGVTQKPHKDKYPLIHYVSLHLLREQGQIDKKMVAIGHQKRIVVSGI